METRPSQTGSTERTQRPGRARGQRIAAGIRRSSENGLTRKTKKPIEDERRVSDEDGGARVDRIPARQPAFDGGRVVVGDEENDHQQGDAQVPGMVTHARVGRRDGARGVREQREQVGEVDDGAQEQPGRQVHGVPQPTRPEGHASAPALSEEVAGDCRQGQQERRQDQLERPAGKRAAARDEDGAAAAREVVRRRVDRRDQALHGGTDAAQRVGRDGVDDVRRRAPACGRWR